MGVCDAAQGVPSSTMTSALRTAGILNLSILCDYDDDDGNNNNTKKNKNSGITLENYHNDQILVIILLHDDCNKMPSSCVCIRTLHDVNMATGCSCNGLRMLQSDDILIEKMRDQASKRKRNGVHCSNRKRGYR